MPTNPRAFTAAPDMSEAAEDSKVTITWEAPEFNGGAPITSYEYRYMPEDGSWTGWQDVEHGLHKGSVRSHPGCEVHV